MTELTVAATVNDDDLSKNVANIQISQKSFLEQFLQTNKLVLLTHKHWLNILQMKSGMKCNGPH